MGLEGPEELARLVPQPGASKRPEGASLGAFMRPQKWGSLRNFLEESHGRAGESVHVWPLLPAPSHPVAHPLPAPRAQRGLDEIT